MLRSSAELWNRTETIPSRDGIYRLRFAAGSQKEGTWDPGYFDFLRTPKQVHEKVAHQEARINDWGGVLVGVYKPADPRKYFLPLVGLAVPVTAALDFTPSAPGAGRVRDATLALYDPTRRTTVRVAGAQRPLAADFGAPLAYYPEPGLLLGFMAMIRPEKYENRAGLYMLEPYDPDRIPVILIHGLTSIPQMWVPTISAIESDPELRGRYQFWVFAYPTGDPIALSALKLRESLAQVYQLYPKTKDMVLISHSMGGLLSQMQAVTTRRVLWDDVFQGDADRLYAKVPADNVVKRALIFDANPRVHRIVFICVPHRGSDLATNWIGSFGIGLISLPGKVLGGAMDVVIAPLKKDVGLKHMPTGINGLSPRSPVLLGLDTLPIHAPLPHHRWRPWQGRYAEQFGRRGSLLEFAPYGRPVGINRARSARFLCSSSDRQRVETHPSLEFGRCQSAAPEHDAKKPAFGCWVEQRAGRSLGKRPRRRPPGRVTPRNPESPSHITEVK